MASLGVQRKLSISRRKALQWLAAATGALLYGCGLGGSRKSADIDWSELQNKIQGSVLPRTDTFYESQRLGMIWNARKPEQYPEAIVHVISETDVIEAIRFAGQHGIRIAIRSGGHHFNGPSLRGGSLLLDLGGLKSIELNTEEQMAMVEPAVTARAFIEALNSHGLAFPVGHCSGVAMSGFLLNGGFGWNSGLWGPACLSIAGVDMVTPSGESVFVDVVTNPDLYWAVRGAGVGFPGVVMRYHLRLYPAPGVIKTSTLVFKIDDLVEAARWLESVQNSIPPSVELSLLILPTQEGEVPGQIFLVVATAFANTEDEARNWLSPFEMGPVDPKPVSSIPLVHTPYEALFASIDGVFLSNHRYLVDQVWTNMALTDLVSSIRDKMMDPPSAKSFVMMAFGPNLPENAPPLPDMALSSFGKIYVGIFGVYNDPAQDADVRNWVHDINEVLQPHMTGRYIGDSNIDEDLDHSQQCFSPEAWERLAAIRKKYDPEGIICTFPDPNVSAG